jgi:formimidoylglutamate deiminase
MNTLYRADLIYLDGKFVSDAGLLLDQSGRILRITPGADDAATVVRLPGKAIVPGFVNTHSHSSGASRNPAS